MNASEFETRLNSAFSSLAATEKGFKSKQHDKNQAYITETRDMEI